MTLQERKTLRLVETSTSTVLQDESLNTMEDWVLVKKTLGGNKSAFGALMARYTPNIMGFLWNKINNPHEMEDLAQEIFLTAYRKLGTLKKQSKFKAWLMQIAKNKVINFYRETSRKPVFLLNKNHIGKCSEKMWEALSDSSPGPAEIALAEQTKRIVIQELEKIKDKYKTVLYLRLFKEESTETIARNMNLTPSTVRTLLHRGLKLLRKALKKQGLDSTLNLNSGTEGRDEI